MDQGIGDNFAMENLPGDLIMVSFDHATMQTRNGKLEFAPAGFIDIWNGERLSVRNSGNGLAHFTLIELAGQ